MNLEPIDTSTTAGKARVMQLAAEGRKVVTREIESTKWYEMTCPIWCWNIDEYAIIAEPVGPDELWALVSEDELLQAALYKPCDVGHWKAVRYIRADLAGEVGV